MLSVRPASLKADTDFSQGERGKFFRPKARHHLPVYLDEDVERYLQEHARSKGVEVAQLVNCRVPADHQCFY